MRMGNWHKIDLKSHFAHMISVWVGKLNLAEQRERRRPANDLHDYLAQLHVVCRMTFGHAKRTTFLPQAEDLAEETIGKTLYING